MNPAMSNMQNIVKNAHDLIDNNINNISTQEKELKKDDQSINSPSSSSPKANDNSLSNSNTFTNLTTTNVTVLKDVIDSTPSSTNSSPIKPAVTKTKPVPKGNVAQMDLSEKLEYSKELGN